jgi:two-component system LytT family response regulator
VSSRFVKIRVLLVDDEPLARDRVRALLANEPELELIGECADGAAAVAAIEEQSPDLVLLDVQMPELDGFEVLARLKQKRPAVIFLTAHDQFALQAFEVHAVDYLLKPFDATRFRTAVGRAVEQIRQRPHREWGSTLSALLSEVRPELRSGTLPRLAVRSSGRLVLIRIDDIDWIEAADNQVSLHVGDQIHLHRDTMTSLEAQLPANKFARINRSTIVNLERVQELQPLFHGDSAILLRDGTRLTLSRGYRSGFDLRMGGSS